MYNYLIFFIILIFLFAFPTILAAQIPDYKEVVHYAAESGEGTWRKATPRVSKNLSSRELFTYALALCEANIHLERLEHLFKLAKKMQDRFPDSDGYGNFRWYWSDDAVEDFNAVEFCMQGGALLWLRHSEKISKSTREILYKILEYAVEGCLRHQVSESYTNIALMNAQNLILLGEALNQPEVADEGYKRLDRFCLYTWEFGIHEYCSPTYYGTDLDCLGLIEAFCQRKRGRRQARALLELFWTDIAASWFPPSQRLGGAHSRDYDYLHGLGHLDVQMWVNGWLPGKPRGGTGVIYPALAQWQPMERLREMSLKRFPRLVRQSWGIAKNQSRTHYLLRDITLSSAGANYGYMDLPLTVDLPGDRNFLRCYFIPDARRDAYGKKKIPAGAHQKARHLRPFWTAAQRYRDALGLVIYRNKDLPENSTTLESHFVMPQNVDDFWIGDQRVEIRKDEPTILPLKEDDVLVLRKNTAAVGIRIPWTQGLDTEQPKLAFIYDGNEYGAVRLTVAHHSFWGIPKANAGTALWVRIGSKLDTDKAFHKWRKKFIKAHTEVKRTLQGVQIKVEGSDGPLVIGTEKPYTEVSILKPLASKAVLELDGKDIGKRILQDIEPIKSYRTKLAETTPVKLKVKESVYWEAESGQVISPMIVAKDKKASKGEYVWMPAEPGEKGGSILGKVTWRLSIAKKGNYYVWGKIIAPTNEDDSFYVRVFTNDGELIDLAEWHTGTHQQWGWTRMTLNQADDPTPIRLPEGEVSLQLRVRENGTKIDCLFITPNVEEKPPSSA